MNHVIKRKGHTESYDERKVYASVYASCMTLRMTDEEAEAIATMVSEEVTSAVNEHKEMSSHNLHQHITKSLKKYHPDAAYMYETHKDIL